MTLDELTALRDAIDALVKLPDRLRDQVAQWLAPTAARPNGRDPHPPQAEPEASARVGKFPTLNDPPHAGKASRGRRPAAAKAAEQRLLTAMRESPGLSANALANAAGASRSTTGERLRRLAARGAIAKDGAGRWRLAGEEASPPAGGPEPRPPQPPAS